jgi:hypothetical protein
MGYSVKVQFPLNNSLEVSGEDVATIVRLVNELTRKFFPTGYASKVEI